MLARSDNDFLLYEKRGSRRRASSGGAGRALARWAAARPATVVGIALFVVTGVIVTLNALTLQEHHRRVDLLGHTVRAVPLQTHPHPPVQAVRILPPMRPATLSPAPQAAKPAPSVQGTGDPIGAMIRNIEGGSTASKPLAAAQRALKKLGYGVLNDDGLMGPNTRAALEKFQKDRHLQVTGALDSATSRALASASGLAIE